MNFIKKWKKNKRGEIKLWLFIKESEQKTKVYNEKCYDEEEKDDLEEEINFNFNRRTCTKLLIEKCY